MTQSTQTPSGERRSSAIGGIWAFLRILNVRLRFIFLMVVVGMTVGYWETIANYYDRWRRPPTAPDTLAAEGTEHYCPMHPNIVRAEMGSCPICGMPLVKRAKTGKVELPEGVLAQVQLTPLKVSLGRIGTSPVEYRLLAREIRTVGIVDYDETRRTFIAARIKGRIDDLFVNYIGQRVEVGDPLVSIYSPDLLTTQEALLVEARRLEEMRKRGAMDVEMQETQVRSARRRLELWGITDQQIDDILRRGEAQTHLIMSSPVAGIVTEKQVLGGHYVMEGEDLYTIADLSRVWMQAKIFEDQFAGIEVGTAVEVKTTAHPDELFAGRITFLAYTVDAQTRTIAARVEIDNPDLKLRPGMYAAAVIRLPVGQVSETPAEQAAARRDDSAGQGTAWDTSALARHYLALAEALSRDATDDAATGRLAQEARSLSGRATPELKAQLATIAEQATQLLEKGVSEQRTLFKALSKQVVETLTAHPPREQRLYVAYCPMVQAEWVQQSKAVRNPYYGSGMLGCGEITATIKSAASEAEERFATGYFCPIFPDRLFERPEVCPIDKFPLRHVRVEKVPALPAAAVINTGTRKIVYRESAPGVFDMLEVLLGPRAGEYFPVLSGIQTGDRVATSGAFCVDAENRLSPGTSALYFGAGGGPSGSEAGAPAK
ncbi:MAG: efflux RND transporter periplasmic adaptor subunit [Planctomycetes bacterium]|nr:efflux RND transporter periplasmic adaptor subunit [Planctomycetota bacterium]